METPRIGEHAPELDLPTHLDTRLRLADLRGHNVVVAFFPLAWTPV